MPPNHDSDRVPKAPVIKYKKKSPAAVARDTKRSKDYHQDRVQTRSSSRITHDQDKEQARSQDAEDFYATVESPILVNSVTPASSMDSPVVSPESRNSESVSCDLFKGQEKLSSSGSENSLTCADSIKDASFNENEQVISTNVSPCDSQSESIPPCKVCQCYSHPAIKHSVYNPQMKMFTCSECNVFVCAGCINRVACRFHSSQIIELVT